MPTDDPNLQRPTRYRYGVMVFLASLAFLTYFDRICISRAQGDIKRDLGISDPQMGIIMGAFWFAYAIFELPAGWMGDRFGARSTLARIVFAWSLFTALSGSATGYASLLAMRFLFGVGEAGAFPNMARIQSRWIPVANRPTFGGLLWMTARWGGAFSPLIFGVMMRGLDSPDFRWVLSKVPAVGHSLSTAAGWRLAFFASGFIGLFWVVSFWFWFRDHPADKAGVNAAELELITRNAPPEVKGHSMPRETWAALFRSRTLLAMGIYYLCGSFGWSFFASWMPRYFKDVQKVPYEQSEWMTAAPMFCGGLFCLLGGIFSQRLVARTGWRRWGRAMFPMFGASTAAAAMFFVPAMKTPLQAMILLCIANAAYDFGQASNWATIVDVGGKYAGSATGLINTVGNMGNAFQPFIGALIFSHFGWSVLFIVYTCTFLVAASMWLVIDPRRTFYASASPSPGTPGEGRGEGRNENER